METSKAYRLNVTTTKTMYELLAFLFHFIVGLLVEGTISTKETQTLSLDQWRAANQVVTHMTCPLFSPPMEKFEVVKFTRIKVIYATKSVKVSSTN